LTIKKKSAKNPLVQEQACTFRFGVINLGRLRKEDLVSPTESQAVAVLSDLHSIEKRIPVMILPILDSSDEDFKMSRFNLVHGKRPSDEGPSEVCKALAFVQVLGNLRVKIKVMRAKYWNEN
jgi:hypothetical protein